MDSKTNHRLKSPVTGIQMALHLLLDGTAGPLSPTQELLIKGAISDCDRLLETVTELTTAPPASEDS